MDKYKKMFKWETALILLLVFEIIVFGAINPRFLNINVLLYSCIASTILFVYVSYRYLLLLSLLLEG